ncbi:hypothetical protein GCM10022215_24070 [Nocardioides fonticola]|uniref:Holin n=1 Tax=Nocardioides fonticola TaxID=450363 RepID=A0ABP7XL53_9ACTN
MTKTPTPLVPSPIAALMAVILTCCIPLNIWLDSASPDYSGAQANYLLSLLIGGILGVDMTRGLRRSSRDDRDEDDDR